MIHVRADGTFTLNGTPQTIEAITPDLKFIGKSAPDFVVTVTTDPQTGKDSVQPVINVCRELGVQVVVKNAAGETTEAVSGIYPRIAAVLNMDMVGRLKNKLVLQGIGSSTYWPSAIESKNAIIGLPITLSNDTDLPTDASSFYRAGVPILSAFTGSHTDYHTPRIRPIN